MEKLNGIITKGIGGFYYVETAQSIYECKAKGSFRKKRITPLTGDYVEIAVNDNAENTIDSIKERKNFLRRPAVSNIDNLFIVISTIEPKPNFLVVDKLIAVSEYKNIEPIILISKTDLSIYDEIYSIYKTTGITTIPIVNDESLKQVKDLMGDKTSAFTGNSGVGKTTLLNKLEPTLNRSTGEISSKLGRGKHTTRECELIKMCGGYVIDTPGFSSFDIDKTEVIKCDDLPYCFREFRDYLGTCKFTSCNHTGDKGCEIYKAVENGQIARSRYDNYVSLYNDAKNIKEWEL